VRGHSGRFCSFLHQPLSLLISVDAAASLDVYWYRKMGGMASDLANLVSELSAEEQSAVREYIEFLRERKTKLPQTPFSAALDEFIAAHPELLRRLAQ
jgi:hypothetical protein